MTCGVACHGMASHRSCHHHHHLSLTYGERGIYPCDAVKTEAPSLTTLPSYLEPRPKIAAHVAGKAYRGYLSTMLRHAFCLGLGLALAFCPRDGWKGEFVMGLQVWRMAYDVLFLRETFSCHCNCNCKQASSVALMTLVVPRDRAVVAKVFTFSSQIF